MNQFLDQFHNNFQKQVANLKESIVACTIDLYF